jgi:hypothetical protein
MSVYTPEEMRQQASRLEFFGQFNEDIIASVVSMLRYAADQLAAQSAPPTPGEAALLDAERGESCEVQVVASAGMPTDEIVLVPPRRENESEEAWRARCVTLKNVAPASLVSEKGK